jgi:heme oxygenase-like protein
MLDPRIIRALEWRDRPALDLARAEIFVSNILFAYAITLASEELIETAINKSLDTELIDYLDKHLAEERHHTEWFREDLASAGLTPGTHWRAAQIAGMQYYLINHVSPQALLGYMAALECRPTPLATVEWLEARYGKPLLRMVRYHAEHDIAHGSDLLQFIETTSGLDYQLIANNIRQTTCLLRDAYKDIANGTL